MSKHNDLHLQSDCPRLVGNFDYRNFHITHLSGDLIDGEAKLLACKLCSRDWLSIAHEPKIYDDDAGVWYCGLIKVDDISSIKQGHMLENARTYLGSLDWYYCGGTYWADRGIEVPFKSSGPTVPWL